MPVWRNVVFLLGALEYCPSGLRGRKYDLTKNTKVVSLFAIVAAIIVLAVFAGRDFLLRPSGVHDCGDGPRPTIDIRDFTAKYSAYSVELEGSLNNKAKLSTKVTPVQLQQLSEAMQNANEFRKFVVAGYNSCALTKEQYVKVGQRFQALDSLAREINQLNGSASLSKEQSQALTSLVPQYAELARKLGSD
jgi:hypothetical protein